MTDVPIVNDLVVDASPIFDDEQHLHVFFTYPDADGTPVYARVDLRFVSLAHALNALSMTPLMHLIAERPQDILVTRSTKESQWGPEKVVFCVLLANGNELVFPERTVPEAQ